MASLFKLDTQKNSIAFLDGVRAIACLLIVWYHVNLAGSHGTDRLGAWSAATVGPLAQLVMLGGWSGVTLFFVLSGFLLFLPYARALLFDSSWPSPKKFYLRRIFRIWPGYYVSLVLLILLTAPQYLQPQFWKETSLFLTFFMDSSPQTYDHLNGPFWTLAVEWQFYLLLPLLAWGMRFIVRHGTFRRRLWMLLLCLSGMIVWGVGTRYIFWHYAWTSDSSAPIMSQLWFRIALFFLYGQSGKNLEIFAVGMLICTCYVIAQNSTIEYRLIAFLRRFAFWVWRVGILWLFFACIWPMFPSLRWLGFFLDAHRWLVDMSFAVGFALCILALLLGPPELRRPLEWVPLRALGQLSYSIYIWHLPILRWLLPFFLALALQGANLRLYLLLLFCELVAVIPFCYVFYCVIERPCMRLSDRLFKSKKPILAQTRAISETS